MAYNPSQFRKFVHPNSISVGHDNSVKEKTLRDVQEAQERIARVMALSTVGNLSQIKLPVSTHAEVLQRDAYLQDAMRCIQFVTAVGRNQCTADADMAQLDQVAEEVSQPTPELRRTPCFRPR